MTGALRQQIEQEARQFAERRAIARRQGIDTPVPSLRGETVARPNAGPLPVYRDPCPRCGVRGDIGCRHHPLMDGGHRHAL